MKVNIELPYFVFGDEVPVHIQAHDIGPKDEEKRVRVFGGQLMDTVVDNTTLSNFNSNIGIFFKLGTRLVERYPHREPELNKAMVLFWSRMQVKYKQLQEK